MLNSPFNVISISILICDLNCSITFSNSFVTLQDRSTGRMIGIGHESQGLFHLSLTPSFTICTSTNVPLLFSFLTNLFFVFLRVCLDAPALCAYLLLAKTSSQLRPRSASSLVIPVFNMVINVILLILINTSLLSMSHSLSNLLCLTSSQHSHP